MLESLRSCTRCSVPYHWMESSSALRLTYCGVLCEQGALGFSIDGLIRSRITRAGPAVSPAEDTIAA